MATATEIATKALKRINVIGAGETPSAPDLADSIDALNAMIASWESKGLSGDVLPLDRRFEKAIIDMLAADMAEGFGKPVTPQLKEDAKDGWSSLSAAFFAVPQSTFESALKWTGPHTVYGYILGSGSGSGLPLWSGSTEYSLRMTVSNGGNIYECTTAGTSAASGGPTGTSDDITDGTAVWVWRRVDGTRNDVQITN